MTNCPCNSGQPFETCCGPILDGTAKAETAEALMRSRYSAHVKGNFEHVAATHAPEAAVDYNISAAKAQFAGIEWQGLDILDTTDGGAEDETGTVTFTARFLENGELHAHREKSDFRKIDGAWMYVDGQINPGIEPRRVEKVGRNEPCPCGSGKKYKKCCGAN